MRNVAFLATVLACRSAAAGLGCTPVVKWTWRGSVESPGAPAPQETPFVARLTDSNLDGRIDAADVPNVVFLHRPIPGTSYTLTVLDGATGAELRTFPQTLRGCDLAVGDVDGDGRADVVTVDGAAERLLALEANGALKWQSDPFPVPGGIHFVGLADLDQDGAVEAFVGALVFEATGRLRFAGMESKGMWDTAARVPISVAADVVPESPGLELLAGPTAYAPDGAVVWTRPSLPDGWDAVADFVGDAAPEIVLTTRTEVYLLDNHGNPLGPPYVPAQSGSNLYITYPTLADLDGDGRPEVFFSVSDHVEALAWDGTGFRQRWMQPTDDGSGRAGSTAFDFDGDGAAEVVYHDQPRWYVFDGRDGSVLWSEPILSSTGYERPVLADLDGDCVPEILVARGGGGAAAANQIVAYECRGAFAARSAFNQYTYHVTNVDDVGGIPRFEPPSWPVPNTWGAQVGRPAGRRPEDLANSLRAVRAALNVRLSWTGVAGAATYNLYRGTTKGVWPGPARTGLSVPPEVLAGDVAWPETLYFYRFSGVSCEGLEGP